MHKVILLRIPMGNGERSRRMKSNYILYCTPQLQTGSIRIFIITIRLRQLRFLLPIQFFYINTGFSSLMGVEILFADQRVNAFYLVHNLGNFKVGCGA